MPVLPSGGGDAADLSVTEGSDLHARGFIQVIAADAAVTYGADDDTNATVSGSGASRMVTYQGSFGQLVVDADGDWLYTLGAGVADLDTALDTADGDTFDAGETLTDAFTVTVNDGPPMPRCRSRSPSMLPVRHRRRITRRR